MCLYVPFILLSGMYLFLNRNNKFMRIIYYSFIPTFILMYLMIGCKHEEQQTVSRVLTLAAMVLLSLIVQMLFLIFYWRKKESIL